MSGKLPSDRARSWRFAHGYLKKTGDPAKIVDKAQSQATTFAGVVGVQVSILKPGSPLHDQINVNEEMKSKIKATAEELTHETEEKLVKKKSIKQSKKSKEK